MTAATPDGQGTAVAAATDVLRVEHISKRFGAVTALRTSTCTWPAGRGARPARRQRRGQVHPAEDPLRLPAARRRPDPAQRPGGDAQVGRPRPLARHRRGLPGPRAGQPAQRLPQHVPQPGDASAGRCCPTGRCAGSPASTWTRWASTSRRWTPTSPSCPAASGRRSRWPARCTPTPRSCCSTSRWPPWAPRRPRIILDLVRDLKAAGDVVDHHHRPQLRPGAGDLRPGQPAAARRDHLRQAQQDTSVPSSTTSSSRSTGGPSRNATSPPDVRSTPPGAAR